MPEGSLEQKAAYDDLREAVVKLCADPKETARSIASSLAYSQKRNWSKIFPFEKEILGPSFDRINWKSVVVMRLALLFTGCPCIPAARSGRRPEQRNQTTQTGPVSHFGPSGEDVFVWTGRLFCCIRSSEGTGELVPWVGPIRKLSHNDTVRPSRNPLA